MRVALISDIHGHMTALEAVLTDVRRRRRVDSIVCLGDVATLGPQPKQVLRKLQSLECDCVLGNHDAAILEPEKSKELQVADPLLPTLTWCARQMTSDEIGYLKSFKETVTISLGNSLNIMCYHGSPKSNVDIILATTPEEKLNGLLQDCKATILAGGHSHIQMLRGFNGMTIINPGSVGSVFKYAPTSGTEPTLQPWAEYSIVDADNATLSIEMFRIRFETEAFIKALLLSEIPLKQWWLKQYESAINNVK